MPESTDTPTLSLKAVCPLCESTQFSVSIFQEGMRPNDLPPDVIGVSDCQSCQRDFLVTVSPELLNVLVALPNMHVLVVQYLQNMNRDEKQLISKLLGNVWP